MGRGQLISPLLRALLLGLSLGAGAELSYAIEAPSILLAETYRGQVDVTRYLVSEKLDGVRAIWDGKVLRFRSGREIHAPAWFLDGLPKQPLDGELWLARGAFERLSGIVRQETPDDAAWRQVSYMIYELPGAAGSFAERAEGIRTLVDNAKRPWLRMVEQIRFADEASLKRHFAEITKAGGEGLVLHRADALYVTGRSDVLLKMKPWQDDEAVVVGYRPGKGKYEGLVGALVVRTPDGIEFQLGSGLSDELRNSPPPVGSMVTYRHRDFTNKGRPRFASFLRVRVD